MSLGLPSRDYFLKEGSLREREAYLKLMVETTTLLGADKSYATEEMSKVLEFETQLANVSIYIMTIFTRMTKYLLRMI